jgi:hypothetical protein
VSAAAPADHDRPIGELTRQREALRRKGVLVHDGRFRVAEGQAGRIDHRLAAATPGPRHAYESGAESRAAGMALVPVLERDSSVGAAVGADRAKAGDQSLCS